MILEKLLDAIGEPVVFNDIWHGVLQDVFVSPVTDDVLAQVMFVKNSFKRQRAEMLSPDLIKASTWDAVNRQVQHYYGQLSEMLNVSLSGEQSLDK